MADQLTPVPSPGFLLIPGFTANQASTFITNERDTWKWKACSYTVSRATTDGKPGEPYLDIVGLSRKEVVFKTTDGREVMRISKENRLLEAPVYHGVSPEGEELWSLEAKSGLVRKKWNLTLHDKSLSAHTIEIAKIDTLTAKKGILLDGNPVVAMGQQGFWSHTHREDVVHVAPGMDVVLALAVNWIKIDQENDAAGALTGA